MEQVLKVNYLKYGNKISPNQMNSDSELEKSINLLMKDSLSANDFF